MQLDVCYTSRAMLCDVDRSCVIVHRIWVIHSYDTNLFIHGSEHYGTNRTDDEGQRRENMNMMQSALWTAWCIGENDLSCSPSDGYVLTG